MSWYSIFTPPSATVYSSFSASRRPPFATVQRTSPPFLIEGGTNLKRLNCVFVEVGGVEVGGGEVGGVWENADAEKSSRRATTRSMKERLRSSLIVHSSLLLLRLYPTAARPRCGRSRCARGDRCGSSPESASAA